LGFIGWLLSDKLFRTALLWPGQLIKLAEGGRSKEPSSVPMRPTRASAEISSHNEIRIEHRKGVDITLRQFSVEYVETQSAIHAISDGIPATRKHSIKPISEESEPSDADPSCVVARRFRKIFRHSIRRRRKCPTNACKHAVPI